MKQLSIQLQSEWRGYGDLSAEVEILSEKVVDHCSGNGIQITSGNEDGLWINLVINTRDVKSL